MKNKIYFLIKQMSGGGAERVISLLCNSLANRGYDVTLIITHQAITGAKLSTIHTGVTIISLEDEVKKTSVRTQKALMLKARVCRKIGRAFLGKPEDDYLIEKYAIRNYDKVHWLKRCFSANEHNILIAFLYDSIYLSLLSAQKNDRKIISERGDPRQCLSSETNVAFFKSMFPKADMMVFQSPDAMQWYQDNTAANGKIIFNPVKPDLPDRYDGTRKKRVVNFCRISSQKNLHLLVNSFSLFVNDYPEYELYIYGDAVGNGAEGYLEDIKKTICLSGCAQKIHILPAQKNIHTVIRDYAMFVSSSDFEGMSNSMLEAMAIGLPTICTDCPAGGARAIIKDHENGILVPVNDVQAMANAMKEVAGDSTLSEKLSVNGVRIREKLTLEKIVKQWMEIIND